MRKAERKALERKWRVGDLLEENRFDFPDGLTANAILELLDTDEIIAHLGAGIISFDEFAEAFSKAGGDLDALAEKALNEHNSSIVDPYDGYVPSKEVQYLEFLLALICAGANVDIADFTGRVECLDIDTKESFYEVLETAGVPC